MANRNWFLAMTGLDLMENHFMESRSIFFPDDSTSIIKSSISIPPGKREPGKYSFRLYLYDDLIAEKEFELRL